VLALVRHTLPQPDIDVPYWLDWLTLWLGWTNSLINPFVYAVNNRDFRTPFREILCCRWTTLQSVCRAQAYAEAYGVVANESAHCRSLLKHDDEAAATRLSESCQ